MREKVAAEVEKITVQTGRKISTILSWFQLSQFCARKKDYRMTGTSGMSTELGVKSFKEFTTPKRVNATVAIPCVSKKDLERDRKRAPQVKALQKDLTDEFDHLHKLYVKFNLFNLRSLALDILKSSEFDQYSAI